MRRQVTPNVAAGRALRTRSLRFPSHRRTHERVTSGRCNRPELSGYCQYQGDDRDGSARLPDHLAPEDAEPDPHARSDHRRNRLHPELTRATADQGAPFLSAAPIGVSGLFRAIRHRG